MCQLLPLDCEIRCFHIQANTKGGTGGQSFVQHSTVDPDLRKEVAKLKQYARLTVEIDDVQQAIALVCI
jgi:hypothetical protein